jgi:Ca2+-transporting ATPase
MFNLLRKKSESTSIIVIDGISCLTNDKIAVDSAWQPKNTTTQINDVLAKTITDISNPIESAIQNHLETNDVPMPRQQPLHVLPFNPHEGLSGNIWHHGSYYLPTVKGMPERIFELCNISDNEREALTTQLHTMTATGNTVIGVATGLLQRPVTNLDQIKHTEKLSFIGFASLKASVSKSAKQLVSKSSMTVYLITGQHPTAAYAIASQLNITSKPGEVFDARRLDVMNEADIKSTVDSVKVYARATPTHKKLILENLNSSDNPVVTVNSAAELDKLLAN